MAEKYGFQYELVQYKWPRWLHQQTEKQRIIWGYKILFLDVLFPLAVDKFLFVDADQVQKHSNAVVWHEILALVSIKHKSALMRFIFESLSTDLHSSCCNLGVFVKQTGESIMHITVMMIHCCHLWVKKSTAGV